MAANTTSIETTSSLSPVEQWATRLSITPEDIEYLINLLLEHETPMSSSDLALELVRRKLEVESTALEDKYHDGLIYNPSQHYEPGQKVIFPALKYATATVQEVRPGNNQQYGDFSVISVRFDDDATKREFASALTSQHKLSSDDDELPPLPGANDFNAAEVLDAAGDDFISELEQYLVENRTLAYVARKWFPGDLLLDVNEGHHHLAEAVLDMMNGGPLTPEQILENMGGLGDTPLPLQVFSLNYSLKEDDRFDEVGPAGQVLWYLTRVEPEEVRQTPAPLRYTPIEVDRAMLTPEMLALEAEIADELSTHLKPASERINQATVTLIYPHRRAGTLPLNLYTRPIFPTARRAPRVYVTLVDGQDGEEYVGWVVHRENYVSGLAPFYRKHKLPIGGYVTARPGSEPGKIVIDLPAHRPRSEYIRLITVKGDSLQFDHHKRLIGTDYDDLMILGVDELQPLDTLVQQINNSPQRRTITAILKMMLPSLSKLTPQGTTHARTLYSAVNVVRRCPPGVLLATLNANPDFENVGGHYWKLAETQ